jgi:hypothetical protein
MDVKKIGYQVLFALRGLYDRLFGWKGAILAGIIVGAAIGVIFNILLPSIAVCFVLGAIWGSFGFLFNPPKVMLLFIYENGSRNQIRAYKLGMELVVDDVFYPISTFEKDNKGNSFPLILDEANVIFVKGEGTGKTFVHGEFVFDEVSKAEMKKIDDCKKRDRIFERIWIGGNGKFALPNDLLNLLSTAVTVILIIMLAYVVFTHFPDIINPIYNAAISEAPKAAANATAKIPIKVAGG